MNTEVSFVLPVIMSLVLGVAIAMYVVLDGFDLGIGILFPFFKEETERDQIMNSVAPFWDGNETWLVLGGVTLWAGFPKAFAAIMPAVYLPTIILLLALILRGVAFEFRWVAKPHHGKWDLSFAVGSAMAAFAQGVILGAILQEIKVEGFQFAGSSFDWLTPFSIMCGLGVMVGYALLGATWLMMKTVDGVERKARRFGVPLLAVLLAFIVVVSIWTPLEIERVAQRWFSVPNIFFLVQVPVATALLSWLCWYGIRHGKPILPFASAVGLFLLAALGLAISNAPYLVPPSITIWQGASAPSAQLFYLIGAAILLPMILVYTALVFWLFRGKIRPGEGYH